MKTWSILFLLFAFEAYSCPAEFIGGQVLKAFTGAKKRVIPDVKETMNRTEFLELLEKFEEKMRPIYESHGFTLEMKWDWDAEFAIRSQRVASDSKNDKKLLYIAGGFARTEKYPKDGVAIALCHEMGHHLGGFPKFKTPKFAWASVEGQSDYYATLKCLRVLWKDDPQNLKIDLAQLPKRVQESCQTQFYQEDDYRICARTVLAAETSALTFYKGRSVEEVKKFGLKTHDKVKVKENFYVANRPQCRLDTFVQGALCDTAVTDELSDKDETKGACHKVNGDKIGMRPRCWFLPAMKPKNFLKDLLG